MKKIFLFVVLALALVLTACGNAASTTKFPTGKFIKSGEKSYGLAFNQDGTFSVFDGDNIFVHGTYKVDGDVFTETSNDGGCKTNVSFNYTFDRKNLTFNYVGNPADDADCTGRNADFNNVTYTLTE
jgi:predicted small secreted protein